MDSKSDTPRAKDSNIDHGELPPLFKKIDTEDYRELYDIRKLFLGIPRHLFLIVCCMALFGLLGAFATYKFTTTYKAEAVVLFQGDEENSSRRIEGGLSVSNLSMATTMEMVKGTKHFEAVKTILGLDLTTQQIAQMVHIPIPRNEAKLISIVVKSDNSNLAIDIANTLAKAAMRSSEEFTRSQLKMVLNSYRSQLLVSKQVLSSQIQEIEDYKVANNYFEMDALYANLLAQVGKARQDRDRATIDHTRNVIEYEELKKQGNILPDYVSNAKNSKESPLVRRVASLETTLAEARAKYAKSNPKLQQLEDELGQLQQKMDGELKVGETSLFQEANPLKEKVGLEVMYLQGKVLSSRKAAEELAKRVEELEKELEMLPVRQMTLVKLLQAKQFTEDRLADMTKAVETAEVMLRIPAGSISLYHLAREAEPWKEGLLVDLLPLVGLLLGLGVGLVLAGYIETKDEKFRTPKQIEMAYSVPCIAQIPEMGALNANIGEARTLFFVRDLADKLERLLRRRNIQGHASVAITSSIHGEGKSCIAYYLARYLARIGKSVVLFEFDYRKNPFVHGSQSKGISLLDYLKGELEVDAEAKPGEVDRICVRKNDLEMKELINSEKMSSLWVTLKKSYDYIIIDAPGVIEEDYTTNLVSMADLCLFVIGSSQVKKATIDDSLGVLEACEVRPCGIVLNRIKQIYVDSARIKFETKKSRHTWLNMLFSWRR